MDGNQSPCPGKENCGSCPWSDIPYERQLAAKLESIQAALDEQRLSVLCSEILPSPTRSHYRNRMDFAIDFEGRVGLRQKGKWWRVIDNHHCFISDEQIEADFQGVRDWTRGAGLSYFDRKKHVGLLRYAVLRASPGGERMINIVTSVPASAQEEAHARAALEELSTALSPTTLIWSRSPEIRDVSFGTDLETIHGAGSIEEVIGGFRYRVSPNAFFQTNSRAAAVLLAEVQTALKSVEARGTFVDLFCGTGFFSIACAGKMTRTVGVEMIPEAVRDARINAELNGASVEFHDILAEKFDWTSLRPDVLLLDPPRAGLHPGMLKMLCAQGPPIVLYVSCNYRAFAVEMAQLAAHYRIASSRAIDMFPHTPHVELLTLLTRK